MNPPRPPRGFRDFTPEQMILRKQLLFRLERVFQRYGFDPIDTPAVEYWETLAGKYGEEAENRLIWKFQDPWSKRWYALRYDLTVPLARFVANHQEIPLPFKRYHIGPVWRHEEPQKGRYREFYQCDADIVGSPYPEADAEIVNLVIDVIRELGFPEGFRVRLNDRRLLRGIFEEELDIRNPIQVYRVIDKLDKIGMEGVINELTKILSNEKVEKIKNIIQIRGGPEEVLDEIATKYGRNKNVDAAVNHLASMLDLAVRKEFIEIDLSLVRGLDYYTGPILEVVLDKPSIGSVAGGGRYDNLIGIFLGKDVPATGASIGIERIIDAGLELGIYKYTKKSVTEVQVVVLDASVYKYAWTVALRLREGGLNTRIDVGRISVKAQRKRVRRFEIPVVAYIGKREASEGKVTLYSTTTGERLVVSLDEAPKAAMKLIR